MTSTSIQIALLGIILPVVLTLLVLLFRLGKYAQSFEQLAVDVTGLKHEVPQLVHEMVTLKGEVTALKTEIADLRQAIRPPLPGFGGRT